MAERGFLDQAMDFADGVVGTLEAATGASSPGTAPEPSRSPAMPRAAATAATAARPWRTVEIVREDHELVFVVTDGIDECECTSRELAEKVRRALQG